MFEEQPKDIQAPIPPASEELEIHVMPEQFYVPEAKSKIGRFVWFGIVAILFIAAVAGITLYYTRELRKPPVPATPPPIVEEKPTETITPAPAPAELLPEVAPEAVPTTTVPELEIPLPSPLVPTILPDSADGDQDGLTDEEEEVYQTAKDNADSDEDGYDDGHEITNFYSPIHKETKRLWEADLVKKYNAPGGLFAIFYPSAFELKLLDETGYDLILSAPEIEELFQISLQENPQKLSLMDWYLNQAPTVSPSQLEEVVTKNKLEGLHSPDKLTVYFAKNDFVLVITLNPGLKNEISFRRTFQVMLDSLTL